MDLSIIIINFNTNQLVLDCIESIYRETKSISFEILVIDNNSQRQNPHLIKETYPEIELVLSNKNVGFGIANNIGIKRAMGRYVLLLNPDTLIEDRALDKTLSFMDTTEAKSNNIGLVGCTLLNKDLTFQNSTFTSSNIHSYLINSNPIFSRVKKYFKTPRNFDYTQTQEVGGVSGACMFFRKEVFEKVKAFDPDIFMYSEETELCRNRISKYYNIVYWPGAKIIHYQGQSAPKPILHYQNMLSYALTWYKSGWRHYSFYVIYSLINLATIAFLRFFFKTARQGSMELTYNGYKKIMKYWFGEIPKYSREWGSRPSPLRLPELK